MNHTEYAAWKRAQVKVHLHKPCKCGENDAAKFSPANWNRCKACTAEAQEQDRNWQTPAYYDWTGLKLGIAIL